MHWTRPLRISVLVSVLALLGSYPSCGRTQKSVTAPAAEEASKTPKANAVKEARLPRAGDVGKQILPTAGAATIKMSGAFGARLGGADITMTKLSGQSGFRLGGLGVAAVTPKASGQLGARLGGVGTTAVKAFFRPLASWLGGQNIPAKENVPVVTSDVTKPSETQTSLVPAPKEEKTDTSKPSKEESPAGQRLQIPLLLGIASLLTATLIGALLGLVFARMRSAAQRVSIETEIATLLGEKSIRLATLPETLRKVEERFRAAGNELRDKIKDITEVNAGYIEKLQQSPHDMYQIKCAATIGSVDDALNAMEAARNDADFEAVETALALRANLQQTRDRLAGLAKTSEAEFYQHLLAALENGHLDHVLSTAGFFDAYFSERQDWRQLRIAYRSIEALLVSMVEANQIKVIQTPVLSIVDAAEMADGQFSDRRNIRAIPVVRQSAARIARDLRPGEFLVVDCLAPGWFSSGPAGRRQPRFAVFEVSTWT